MASHSTHDGTGSDADADRTPTSATTLAEPAAATTSGCPRHDDAGADASLHPPRRLVSPAIGERVFAGTMDRTVAWTAHHPRIEDLEALRTVGDPLADDALDALLAARITASVPIHDLVSALRDAATALDAHDATSPYTQLAPHHQTAIRALWAQVTTVPDWVDWTRVKDGQDFYYQHATAMAWILAMGSLLTVYTAASIGAVLDATAYLTGHGKGDDRVVARRIVETGHMINLAMWSTDALRPGGEGWASVVNVRFLHALVRRRVLAKAKVGTYSVALHGVPVNQEDMAFTGLSFVAIVLMGLERLGFISGITTPGRNPPDLAKGIDGYVHAWAYIQYLSGIRDDVNPYIPPSAAAKIAEEARAAGLAGAGALAPPATEDPGADTCTHLLRVMDATGYHLYSPSATAHALAAALLNGIRYVPPTYLPNRTSRTVARLLLGDRATTDLGVPATSEADVVAARRTVRFVFRPLVAAWRYVPVLRPIIRKALMYLHMRAMQELVLRPASAKGTEFAFHTGNGGEMEGSAAVCPFASVAAGKTVEKEHGGSAVMAIGLGVVVAAVTVGVTAVWRV
ncbi:hypothetical protein AMAG_14625 [Allomyces macrogynus ATCC 38327]|uniref:Uncharacterized protein n=1 Tax=Allomyces macrogynus (strain ATCC 38327) TaxID=578462 RepID=A0A0L0T746_ALLM3|nr:hypothetical protein AMAG_14625 [Allomyces macrogynus ATCC 38327]|eukprot:KNE70501.1 hypothetical protein AMAG_14625 [Allomyces macrogynus ATCC 38327]